MICNHWLWALTIACGLVARTSAEEPTAVVQLQPAGKLLDTLVKTANRLKPPGPGQPASEKQILREMLGTDDISGLDRDRPFGLVIDLDTDPAKRRLLVLLPITDAANFRGLLGRLGLKPMKDRDAEGVEAFAGPFLPEPIYVRFHPDRYAYLSPRDPAAVNPQGLPAASAVFDAKERGTVVARLRLDHVPEAERKQVNDLWENQVRKWTGPGGPPDAQDLGTSLTTLIGRTGRAALTDGREAILRLDLDPKTVTVTAEVQLTAKPGAPLAKEIAEYWPPTNRFADLASPDAAASILLRAPLFAPEIRTAADAILKRASGTADDHQPPVPAEFINALRRSVQAGELTFGAAVRGPDKDGRFTAVAGLSLADTRPLAKALRSMISEARVGPWPYVYKLDAEKVGTIPVHHIDQFPVMEQSNVEPVKKAFGDGPVRFAFAPDAVVVAIGPDGLTRLAEALAMKPRPAPCVDATISVKKLLPVLGLFDANAEKQLREYFGDLDRLTLLRLTTDGGSAFTVKFSFSALLMPRAAGSSTPAKARPPG